jgi:multimeric flavodoxin WrbA
MPRPRKPTVLVVLGSPRKRGNSALLAAQMASGAERAGAAIRTVFLHGLHLQPCRGCWQCQRAGSTGCAIPDDMQPVYRQMVAAEAWVIASPVYWFTVSAQTKLWMDRCLALPAYGPEPFAGKRIAIALTYGGQDPFDSGAVNALRTFQDAYRYTGSTLVGMVYGSAMEAGAIRKDRALMKAAQDLGKKLVAGIAPSELDGRRYATA